MLGLGIILSLSLATMISARATSPLPTLAAPDYRTFGHLMLSAPGRQIAVLAGADALTPDNGKLVATVLRAGLSAQALGTQQVAVQQKLADLRAQGAFPMLSGADEITVLPVQHGLARLTDYAQQVLTALQACGLAASVSVDVLGDRVQVQTPGDTARLAPVLAGLGLPPGTYALSSAPVHFLKKEDTSAPTPAPVVDRLSNTTQLSGGVRISTDYACTYSFTGITSTGSRVGITARHCIGADANVRHPDGGAVLGTAQVSAATASTDAVMINLGTTLAAQSVSATSRSVALATSPTDDTIVSRLPIRGTASGLSQPAEIDMTGASSFVRKWQKGSDYSVVSLVADTNIPTASGFTVTGTQECIRLTHPDSGNLVGQLIKTGDSGSPVYTPDGLLLGIASNYRPISYTTVVGNVGSVVTAINVCYVPIGTITTALGVSPLTQ